MDRNAGLYGCHAAESKLFCAGANEAESENALQTRGIDGEKARLGHFFYCVAEAFAAEARVFCAAVRHVVDAEGRNFSDHQAAYFESLEGARDAFEIAREDAGLQPNSERFSTSSDVS